jgi:hypothetical protein
VASVLRVPSILDRLTQRSDALADPDDALRQQTATVLVLSDFFRAALDGAEGGRGEK